MEYAAKPGLSAPPLPTPCYNGPMTVSELIAVSMDQRANELIIARPPLTWLLWFCGTVLMLLAFLCAVNDGSIGWKVRLFVGLGAFGGAVFLIHLGVKLVYLQ